MPNWGGMAQGAAGGATTGSMFGPIGTGIGAGIGGLVGLFKKKKPKANTSPTGPSGGSWEDIMKQYGGIMPGYQEFAKTGGLSAQDQANMRSRAVSPIRSIYQRAQSEIGRQRTLQGGYSPNYTAAMTKMAREQSMNAADASTNTEAQMADMIRQGKLAGLAGQTQVTGGMSNLWQGKQNAPSDYQRKLSSIGGTLETGANIAGGLAKIFG